MGFRFLFPTNPNDGSPIAPPPSHPATHLVFFFVSLFFVFAFGFFFFFPSALHLNRKWKPPAIVFDASPRNVENDFFFKYLFFFFFTQNAVELDEDFGGYRVLAFIFFNRLLFSFDRI